MRSPCVIVLLSLAPGVVSAAGELELNGRNELRVEQYGRAGTPEASPFAHEGVQTVDNLELGFNYQAGAYERWQGRFSGVSSDSAYRSDPDGFVPQVISLDYENGDASVPFRVGLGNQYADFSYRTLHRAFKGARVELQPGERRAGEWRQSVVLTAGLADTSWRETNGAGERLGGVSWLLEKPQWGRLSVNYAVDEREGAGFQLPRLQQVGSVAFAAPLSIGAHDVTVEGELARFQGDHADLVGRGSGQGRSDAGYFLQVAGEGGSPLQYRARFEQYGRHFRPAGATVVPHRRSQELRLGWGFDSGLNWWGRAQHYEDDFEETRSQASTLYGMQLAGPLLAGLDDELSGRIDASVQEWVNERNGFEQNLDSIELELSRPLAEQWSAQLDVRYSDLHKQQFTAKAQRQIIRYRLDFSHSMDVWGLDGTLSPRIEYRDVSGFAENENLRGELGLALSGQAHSLSLNTGYLQQRWPGPRTLEATQASSSLRYHYQQGHNSFGLEAEMLERDSQRIRETSSYRISATWSYEFSVEVANAPWHSRSERRDGEPLRGDVSLMATLSRYETMNAVGTALARAAIANRSVEMPYGRAYEVALIDAVDARQSLVVLGSDAFVEAAALIVDFPELGDARAASRTYAEVVRAMLREYGSPDRRVAEGAFTNDWVTAVNGGRLVRTMEWKLNGRVIRLGIPKRLDGRVRIEIQNVASSPEAHDLYWSVQALR